MRNVLKGGPKLVTGKSEQKIYFLSVFVYQFQAFRQFRPVYGITFLRGGCFQVNSRKSNKPNLIGNFRSFCMFLFLRVNGKQPLCWETFLIVTSTSPSVSSKSKWARPTANCVSFFEARHIGVAVIITTVGDFYITVETSKTNKAVASVIIHKIFACS